MKCLKVLLLSALLIAASCSKEPSNKELPAPSEAVLKVSVLGQPGGKAEDSSASLEYEEKIESLQILVFDAGNGMLNHYADIGKNDCATISVYTGPKLLYAMANGPCLDMVSSLDELSELVLPVYSFNSKSGSFAMFAVENIILSGDVEVTMYLQRFLSRIRLSTVSNSLPPAYGTLVLKSVCLGNVPSSVAWDGAFLQGKCLNVKGIPDSPRNELTAMPMTQGIGNGSSLQLGLPLYCCGNESVSEPTFLTVEAQIAGHTYFYPVYFDNSSLIPNSSMDINLNIVGLGSDTPWEKVEKNSVGIEISVRNWTFVSSYSENI